MSDLLSDRLHAVPPLPPDLTVRVLRRVHQACVRRLWQQFWFACSCAVIVGVYIVTFAGEMWGEIQHSSFIQYAQLLFTDTDIVFVNVQDFFMGIIESLPIEICLIVLAFLTCFVASVRFLFPLLRERGLTLKESYMS